MRRLAARFRCWTSGHVEVRLGEDLRTTATIQGRGTDGLLREREVPALARTIVCDRCETVLRGEVVLLSAPSRTAFDAEQSP